MGHGRSWNKKAACPADFFDVVSNFQDLTGQRITKVVRALTFIEERVDAMMGVWHRKEFETMPLPPGTAHRDGNLELHGPNDANPKTGMISQDDIDKLFG